MNGLRCVVWCGELLKNRSDGAWVVCLLAPEMQTRDPASTFTVGNWLIGLVVLALGILLPIAVVARKNRLFGRAKRAS